MRQPLALADCTEAVKLAVIPKPPFKTASVMEHRGEKPWPYAGNPDGLPWGETNGH